MLIKVTSKLSSLFSTNLTIQISSIVEYLFMENVENDLQNRIVLKSIGNVVFDPSYNVLNLRSSLSHLILASLITILDDAKG